MALVILVPGSMQAAFAEPVVLKDASRGIGVEDSGSAPERDRSLQDGTLVYSTCSILKDENERQAEAFLIRHPEFTEAALPETILLWKHQPTEATAQDDTSSASEKPAYSDAEPLVEMPATALA